MSLALGFLETLTQAALSLLPLAIIRGLIELLVSVEHKKTSFTRQDMHTLINGLQSEATIATFLAAVQAQTLSYSFTFDSNASGSLNANQRLQITTNALAFSGLIFDVIGAFLALLTSTLLQAHIQRVEGFLDTLKNSPSMELTFSVTQETEVLKEIGSTSPLGESIAYEIFEILRQRLASEASAHEDPLLRVEREYSPNYPSRRKVLSLKDLSQMIDYMQKMQNVGEAAGTSILLGFTCFLASIITLAIMSQPAGVYVPAIIACSCIGILPAINRSLTVFGLKLPNVF